MQIVVYNSMARDKAALVPKEPGSLGIYVCGPTVYDLSHIGHARVYVAFDTIVRFLRQHFRVTYVRNYTDVDDKIIARAQREKLTPSEVAEHNIAEFQRDMARLQVLPADHEPKVTAHIDEIVALCARLLEQGHAYAVSGDLYYAVERFADYGKLGRRSLSDMEAGIRVEINSQKRHPMDFVLWKAAKPGEPAWEAPWGRGRPGWHIECSAMAKKYLGEGFDLHGGGRDLMFPHHENEVAQSEAASGKPYANVWLHGGLVNIDNQKMSKSLGNFFTIRQVLDKFDAATLRYYLLSTHYRSPIAFSDAALADAEQRVLYCYRTLVRLEQSGKEARGNIRAEAKATTPSKRTELLGQASARFTAVMADDFNTPEALGVVADILAAVNDVLDHPTAAGPDESKLAEAKAALKVVSEVLGLFGEEPSAVVARIEQRQLVAKGIDAADIDAKLKERDKARADKDFARADGIRKSLEQRGIEVLDQRGSATTWRLQAAKPARGTL